MHDLPESWPLCFGISGDVLCVDLNVALSAFILMFSGVISEKLRDAGKLYSIFPPLFTAKNRKLRSCHIRIPQSHALFSWSFFISQGIPPVSSEIESHP